MQRLPTGTVTFLFTDIEGSTRLLDEVGVERYAEALAEHRRLVREACSARGGVEIDTEGDAFFVAFARASDAVTAAADAQRALAPGPVRVRMGVHTGEPLVHEGNYVGMDVHRAARIAAAAHGGQVLLSQTARDLLGDVVALRDLGAHRLKDLSAPQRLYQLGPGDFPLLKSLSFTNLPVQPTQLVGRELELEEAGALLREHRLTTLVGPGGTGKTRLALQLAAEAAEEFQHGVFFVSLSALRDPDLVEPTVAQVVGAKDGLADHLQEKRILLLLDNFEHLVAAAPRVAALLQATSDVKVLVTSREPLRISGEHEYPVPPLPEADAVALFVERARALRPGFAAGEAVADICRRLDGLPLALELAAARVKALTPAQILERLERRFDLLTRGVRDAPARQRTLRATLEWSYELLGEAERRLFRALAVFAGSFSLEAAEEIADMDVDALASLMDKSLLRQTDDGRVFLLETIREYAAERLEEHGEAAELRRAHRRYYLALAQRAAAEVRGPAQETWLELLEQQHANFSAALKGFLDEGDVEAALRIGGALAPFWELRGRAVEGRALLEPALRQAPSGSAEVRARALYGAGRLAYTQDDWARVHELLEEALELFRSAGDPSGELLCEIELAGTAILDGDLAHASAFALRAVGRATELGDAWVLAYALRLHGSTSLEAGEMGDAREAWLESLERFRACGDPREIAGTLANLAWFSIVAAEYAEALPLIEESLAHSSPHDAELRAINHSNLGLVKLFEGDDSGAIAGVSEALAFAVPEGQQGVVAESLFTLAGVAARRGKDAEAARLAGAARSIHEACRAALNPVEERVQERFLVDLGERVHRAAGASMTLHDAAAYAAEVAAAIRGEVA